MSTIDNAKQAAIGKRRCYEDLERVRRRLARLAGQGVITAGAYAALEDRLNSLKEDIANAPRGQSLVDDSE